MRSLLDLLGACQRLWGGSEVEPSPPSRVKRIQLDRMTAIESARSEQTKRVTGALY
jgi:hypothetical protein